MSSLRTRRRGLGSRLVAVAVAVCLVAGSAGNAFALFGRFKAEDERKLSEKFMVMVRERFEVMDDPAVNSYINDLGNRLAAQLDYQSWPLHFYVINSETLNAFSAPAGHIFIFSGLITRMNNEGELASIIAHEIGHVSNGHLAKQMEQGAKISLATLALALAGAFLGGGGQAAEAATMTSLAAGASLQLKYSREYEQEADRTGLHLLTKAGYSGEDMASALRTIYRFRWYGSDEVPTYLSTHPGLDQRISYIEDQLLSSPPAPGPRRSPDPLVLKKVQTRLLACLGDGKLCVSRFQGQIREHPEDFMGYYGLGLAYRRLAQATEAQAAFKKAVSLRPNDPDLLCDLGVSYFDAGKTAEALGPLRQALAARPTDAEAIYYLGRAAQESGDWDTALTSYRRLVAAGLESDEIYQELGKVCAKKGDLAAGHFYSGLGFKLRGDLRNAVFHLSQALPLYKGRPEEEKVRQALKDAQEELGKAPKEPPKERQPGQPAPKTLQLY